MVGWLVDGWLIDWLVGSLVGWTGVPRTQKLGPLGPSYKRFPLVRQEWVRWIAAFKMLYPLPDILVFRFVIFFWFAPPCSNANSGVCQGEGIRLFYIFVFDDVCFALDVTAVDLYKTYVMYHHLSCLKMYV